MTNIINGGLPTVLSDVQKVMLIDSAGNSIDNLFQVSGGSFGVPGSTTNNGVVTWSGTNGVGVLSPANVTISSTGNISTSGTLTISGVINSVSGLSTSSTISGATILSTNSISSTISGTQLNVGNINANVISGLAYPPNTSEDPFYRYNQQPLLNFTNNPTILSSSGNGTVGNYGTWDGENFWIGDFGAHSISKFSQSNKLIGTYAIGNGYRPLQLAYDNRYIWIGSADPSGTLIKFDPLTNTVSGTTLLNPGASGSGGVQSVIYDGEFIYAGVASNNTIFQIAPSGGNILAQISGQSNVNGIAALDQVTPSGNQRYIWAANSNNVSKLNFPTLTYQSFTPAQVGYRLCTDGTFIYVAGINQGYVSKLLATTGQLVQTWTFNSPSGSAGNDIAFDGKNIWLVNNSETAYIFDRDSGNVIETIPNFGDTSLVFDGSYMWGVAAMPNPAIVRKAFIGEQLGNLKSFGSFSVMSSGNVPAYKMSTQQNAFIVNNNSIVMTASNGNQYGLTISTSGTLVIASGVWY